MEPFLTELYNLSGQKRAADPSVLGGAEMEPGLGWGRKGHCGALLEDASCQKKEQQQQQQLLGVGSCEDQPACRERRAEQRSLEVGMVLQQEAKGQPPPLQGGELLGQKKRLDSGRWPLKLESESDCEEIYWGCFYFFPWLRMWKRERRVQL